MSPSAYGLPCVYDKATSFLMMIVHYICSHCYDAISVGSVAQLRLHSNKNVKVILLFC